MTERKHLPILSPGGLCSALLDLLFPPRCPFCHKLLAVGERGLCSACQKDLPWLTGAEAGQKGEFYRLCVSPLRYQGQVRASIHRYKFKGSRGYAGIYGALVAQCVADNLEGEYDLISWVPLSKKRRRERGYDQARLLAEAAVRVLGTSAAETLRKKRHTGAQSSLKGEAERRANVLGAYEVTDEALVAGKRVLLVDDVLTTGSTLSECARALRTAGAKEVVCATLARVK